MAEQHYAYIIVGTGLAAASAVEGIRLHDKNGAILLVGAEPDLPYDRPPLSKQLWSGGKQIEDIFLHDQAFYSSHGVQLRLGTEVVALDPAAHAIRDRNGMRYRLLSRGRPGAKADRTLGQHNIF